MSMTTVLRDPGTRSRARARVADSGQPALSPATASAMASMFRVLGDPTRVRLIGALASGERTVGALAHAVGMTESAVSHQLRVLKDARMVKGRPAGRQVYYALDDLHVLTLFRQALTHAREATGAEAPR
jgi:DNA-binding transcriptional ArsR family regulator